MTPRNRQHVRAEWWVPRIQTTQNKDYPSKPSHVMSRNRSSPLSLPSMLGESPNNEEDDSVSELESPMLFGNAEYNNYCASSTQRSSMGGGGESDIQSQSQATDIQSLKTLPTPTAAAAVATIATASNTTRRPAEDAASVDEPLMRIRRCNATDEEDNNNNRTEEMDYHTDDDTLIQPVMTPTGIGAVVIERRHCSRSTGCRLVLHTCFTTLCQQCSSSRTSSRDHASRRAK